MNLLKLYSRSGKCDGGCALDGKTLPSDAAVLLAISLIIPSEGWAAYSSVLVINARQSVQTTTFLSSGESSLITACKVSNSAGSKSQLGSIRQSTLTSTRITQASPKSSVLGCGGTRGSYSAVLHSSPKGHSILYLF